MLGEQMMKPTSVDGGKGTVELDAEEVLHHTQAVTRQARTVFSVMCAASPIALLGSSPVSPVAALVVASPHHAERLRAVDSRTTRRPAKIRLRRLSFGVSIEAVNSLKAALPS